MIAPPMHEDRPDRAATRQRRRSLSTARPPARERPARRRRTPRGGRWWLAASPKIAFTNAHGSRERPPSAPPAPRYGFFGPLEAPVGAAAAVDASPGAR